MKNWKERNGKLKWRIEWQVQWDSAEEKIRKVRKNQRLDLSTLKNINSGKYFGRAMIQLDSCGYKNADSESNSAPDEGQYFCCFIHNLRDCKISQRLVLSEPCVLASFVSTFMSLLFFHREKMPSVKMRRNSNYLCHSSSSCFYKH